MLSKLLFKKNTISVFNNSRRLFSTTAVANPHKQNHTNLIMDCKFYENEFLSTSINEIEFVRSPMYELAKGQYMGESMTHDFLEEIGMKSAMIDSTSNLLMAPQPTKEDASFKRYADKSSAPDDQKFIFQQPRAQEYIRT